MAPLSLPTVAFNLPRMSLARNKSRRISRGVACSASPQDIRKECVQKANTLRKQLESAVSTEDYSAAAALRDELRRVEASDPLISLQAALSLAILENRFPDAATLRDQIFELDPPPAAIPCASDAATRGIRVIAESRYVPERSRQGYHFFSYKIQIVNESEQTVQLLSRAWLITDGNGEVSQVRGPGVVGETPTLAPGQSFSYNSACPLPTAAGSMAGSFRFRVVSSDEGGLGGDSGASSEAPGPVPGAARGGAMGVWQTEYVEEGSDGGQLFDVEIGQFGLDVQNQPVTLPAVVAPTSGGGGGSTSS